MSTASEVRERAIKDKARAYLAARSNSTTGTPMPEGPKLVSRESETPLDVRLWEEAVEQVRRAKEIMDLPIEAFLRYPLPWLDALVGGVRMNRVHTYVTASNNGKSLFVKSFMNGAAAQGQRCSVMTTETDQADWRIQMAAAEVGLHPGDIATGEYLLRPDADEVRDRINAEMDRLAEYETGAFSTVRVSTTAGHLTPEKIRAEARVVADAGYDWFLIDHIDHVEGTGKMTEPAMSNAVVDAIWRAAMDLDLRILCTSQLNQDVFRQNPLGMCIPPQESWVKYGGKKKEVSWVMLSGNRPLKPFRDEKERAIEIAAYKAGQRTIRDITIPALQVRVMKHRDYGERVGASCMLEVQNGRLVAPTKDTLADIHGIATTPRLRI